MQGSRTSVNQDSYSIDDDFQCFIVADGVGGGRGGDIASSMAVRILGRYASTLATVRTESARAAVIQSAFYLANRRLLHAGEQNPNLRGMGTTAVMATAIESRLYVAAVGDSRCYLIRNGCPCRLTVDQTIGQLLLEAGYYQEVPPQELPRRNVLWNCLGRDRFSGVDPQLTTMQANDRLVLASDGLTDVVDDGLLARVVSAHEDPQDAADHLVAISRSLGTSDDSSCVVVFMNDQQGPVR
jgi:protein phosphatase